MKSITIVIPNFNGMRFLAGCLDSLRGQTDRDFQTVLIDNGSTDGSVTFVRENYPEVRVRAYGRNTGFCRAVNAGIRMSRTPYVLLLNNDVVCDEDMVRCLHRAIEERPRAFSCCAKLLSMADPSKIDDAGDFYTILGWAFARGKGSSSGLYSRDEKIFACCAAAAIYRRSMLDEIGMFDERHFAYLEDIDIGYRALRHGYENWYIPGAVVNHAGSGTSGSRHNAFKVKLSSRNSVWLIRKNMPGWQIALNLPALAAGFGIKIIYFTAKKLGKEYLSGLMYGLRTSGRFEAPCGGDPAVYLRIELSLIRAFFLRMSEWVGKHSD